MKGSPEVSIDSGSWDFMGERNCKFQGGGMVTLTNTGI